MADPLALASLRAIEKQGQAQAPGGPGMDPGLMGWSSPMGSYSGWVAGRPVGPALPRPYQDFLSGAFGPFVPIQPMPIDQPEEGEERPFPRRLQYPVGWNLPIGQPGTEGLMLASFQMLRQLVERYSTLAGMLNIRVKEMAGLAWDVGPTKDAQEKSKSDKGYAKDLTARSAQVVKWFRQGIDSNYEGFQSWFTAALWDQFVCDAVAVHPLPTRVKGKGLFGSGLAEWELLDATTIRPLYDVRGARPQPPAVAYQQFLWGVPRVDLLQVLAIGDMKETEKLMLAAGIAADLDDLEPDATFRGDQVLYWRQTPRTHTPYGFSPVSMALLPIAIGLQRQIWLNDYWAEGTIPGVYVIAGPQYQTGTQQRQLQDSLNALAGDVAWKHRVIVLPPGSESKPQKDLSFTKEIDQVITEMMMIPLQIQPHEIGQTPGGKSSGLGGKGATEQMQENTERTRTKADRELWKGRFDRHIQNRLLQDDLEWKWVEYVEDDDEEKRAAAERSDLESGQTTIDELRVDRGRDAFGFPLTGSPFIRTATGLVPLDPDVSVPAPIVPGPGAGGLPSGAPVGVSAEPVEPSGEPAEGARKPQDEGKEPGGTDGPATPERGKTPPPASAGKPPEAKAPPDDGKKLTLADVLKWRIKYKDAKLPEIVHTYLLRSYPEKDVEWATDPKIEWEYEPHQPLDKVNWTRRPGGRDPEKEASIASSLSDGASMDPCVLVEFDSAAYNRSGLNVADGFHRTGGADEAGWKDIPAFIGRHVPDKYRGLIRGAMQDNSASIADQKKAVLAELGILRRYLKTGKAPSKFTPSALKVDDVERVAALVLAKGLDVAFLSEVETLAGVHTAGLTWEQAFNQARTALGKYSDDQPRGDDGKWTAGSGGPAEDEAVRQFLGAFSESASAEQIQQARGFVRQQAEWREFQRQQQEFGDAFRRGLGLHDRPQVPATKDVGLGSPLASGLAPFDLEGAAPNAEAQGPAPRCTVCWRPLVNERCPWGHDVAAAKAASLTLARLLDDELARRGLSDAG